MIYWLLVGLVMLAPLPFGSVLPWAWAPLTLVVGILLVAYSAVRLAGHAPEGVPLHRIWLPAALFAAAMAWAAAQAGWLSLATAWHHPLWADAGAVLGVDAAGATSLDPHRTESTLLRLLAYAGVFWIALQSGRDPAVARTTLKVVVWVVSAYAVYGLVVEILGTQTVLWVKKDWYLYSLTSTFINRNSWATYAGLGFICATGLLANRTAQLHRSGHSARSRARIILREMTSRGVPLIIMWMIIGGALLLSDSRAGIMSAAIGVVVLLVLLGTKRGFPAIIAKSMGVFVVVAAVGFVSLRGVGVIDRISSTTSGSEDVRLSLYEMTYRAMSDYAWLGSGFGTFENVFSLYRQDAAAHLLRSTKAHNTYLESMVELGIPAALCLILAVVLIAVICLIGVWQRRRNVIFPAVGAAASVVVGLHSIVDFSLQIPAVAMTYALVLGVACAQSWSTQTDAR